MNTRNDCINTQQRDIKTINTSEFKVEQELNPIIDDKDFNKEDTIEQTPYIDSNRVQTTKDVKVKNKINIYENYTQFSLNAIQNSLPENKLITLKEFDSILNDYRNENFIGNNSYDLNINELIFNLDELDLIINDLNNINNVASEKLKDIEDFDKNECIRLEKLNKILKEFNNKDTIVIENNLLITQLSLDTTESFTSKDNIKELNSLREFRKTNTNLLSIDKNEIVYDFEKNIKVNEIFISNDNIESTLKTDDINDINSVQSISKVPTEGNLKQTAPFIDEIDVISISSDEDIKSIIEVDQNESNDSDCSDYHSSDFEFIDEDEAKKTGFVVNKSTKVITPEIEKQNSQELFIYDYFYSSKITDKDNHAIPQGVDYISLFGGNYTPLPTLSVQNKAINVGTSMNAGVDGIGFDMRMLQKNPELEAYKDEAHESERKILKLYPIENRRKRFRRY